MKAELIQLPDGREFPVYNGEPLSWVISPTLTDEKEGFPRLRSVIRAMMEKRPEMLEEERRQLVKSSLCNPVFGVVAERVLKIVEEEINHKPL